MDNISDTTVYTWGKGDPLPEQLASSAYTQDPSRLISVTHSDQDCNGMTLWREVQQCCGRGT